MRKKVTAEKYDSAKIARLLFVVNLPLSILSVVVVLIFIVQGARGKLTSIVIDSQFILLGTLLIVGFTAEVVYYLQGRFTNYAQNKMFWYYSIVVQIMFILTYLYDLLLAKPSVGMIGFIVYPIVFLVLSCIALSKATKVD